jgi:Trk K+ transport system NAD-binding subunit
LQTQPTVKVLTENELPASYIYDQVSQRIADWLRGPITGRVLREASPVRQISHVEKDWAISLVTIKRSSKSIDLSVAEVTVEGEIEILGINRAGAYVIRPDGEEEIAERDRFLVYASRKPVKRIRA